MSINEIAAILQKLTSSSDFFYGFVFGSLIAGLVVYWLTNISIKSHKEALEAKKENLNDIKIRKSTLEIQLKDIQKKFGELIEEQEYLRNAYADEAINNDIFSNAYFNLNYLIQLEQFLDYLYHLLFLYNQLNKKPKVNEIPINAEPDFWEIRKIQDGIWKETRILYSCISTIRDKETMISVMQDKTKFYEEEYYNKLVEAYQNLDPKIVDTVAGPRMTKYLKEKYGEDSWKDSYPRPGN
jgi:hypothetical protein